ncbi:sushi, von Willebrand factor type A, EGF and pentraxin domain-containing protein 1-like, partial [Gigantopelta aegis]|uniref:sushi, von Willebrand factor type A, EGF and pentraxin domain-containing protein 1-like n=1 Tax=Gigantopelta aegis TaxID=1735272 RepID=UPI001B889555
MCTTGYIYVSGSNTSTCQSNGQWSDPALNCTGIDCGTPISIQEAELTYSNTAFPSVASYSCKTGYAYVSGSNSSTCQSNGQWSDPALNCTGNDCGTPTNILEADLTYSSTIFQSIANYTCKTGYVYVSGSISSTCQASGQWSDPGLNCTGVDCNVPSSISGSDVSYSSTIFPTTADYTCTTGFVYVSGSNTSTCQANGQWSDPMLNCTGIDCGTPINISEADLTYSSTIFPAVTSYSCKTGYVYVSGSNSSTCQASGQWSDPGLNCTAVLLATIPPAVDCDNPSSVPGADLSVSDTTPPAVANYTCKTGYVYVSGSNSSECLANGQWSDPALNCTEIDCGAPSTILGVTATTSATTYQSVTDYACGTGYVYVSGSNTSSCQANGQWSDPALICTEIDCGAPSTILGSSVTSVDTTYQSVADYACSTGYVYVSGSNTSSCQANGQWSDPALICTEIDCGAPITISGASESASATTYQSVTNYACATGYVYVSGLNTSSCQANGQWSDPALDCAEIDCGTPSTILGASVTSVDTTYQSVVHYACANGYVYVSGLNTSSCQANGQWSDPALICTVMCPAPPPIANGHVAYDSLSVNSVANYSCVSNYFYFGYSNRSVCHTDGSWAFPMHGVFAGPVTAGWKAEVLATPRNESRTTVELRYANSAYRAIQMDIRFNFGTYVNTVVRNTLTSAGWGYENSTQPYFPFAIGRPFNLTIVMTVSSGFD